MTTATKDTTGLSNRLGALEADVGELRSVVAAIDAKQAETSRGLVTLVQSVDQLRVTVQAESRPQWGVLGTWAGVLLTVILAIGGIVAFGINGRIDHVSEALKEHEQLPAHPDMLREQGRSAERISALESGLEKLDVTLQREMRILDATQQQALMSLDERLQRETALMDDVVAERVRANYELQTERVRALEQRLTERESDR